MVKNDSLISHQKKSYWWLCKYSYFGKYECTTGKCYPDQFYTSSNFPEYLEVEQTRIFNWTQKKVYTEGHSNYLSNADVPIKIDRSRLFLGELNSYGSSSDGKSWNTKDTFCLLGNDTLQKIHWENVSSPYPGGTGKYKSEFYYLPLNGQIPPANWPQKIRTDSTLRSDVQGEWALFTLRTDDSSLIWKDDSIKYSLTLKNDSGFLFYNNTQLLSFYYGFRNFSLEFYSSFLKIDTLENLNKPTCISDYIWSIENSAYVSDKLDTIVVTNGLYHYWTEENCFWSRYYFKRVQHN